MDFPKDILKSCISGYIAPDDIAQLFKSNISIATVDFLRSIYIDITMDDNVLLKIAIANNRSDVVRHLIIVGANIRSVKGFLLTSFLMYCDEYLLIDALRHIPIGRHPTIYDIINIRPNYVTTLLDRVGRNDAQVSNAIFRILCETNQCAAIEKIGLARFVMGDILTGFINACSSNYYRLAKLLVPYVGEINRSIDELLMISITRGYTKVTQLLLANFTCEVSATTMARAYACVPYAVFLQLADRCPTYECVSKYVY
jgi:hypothetical protein